jgi:Uma2 family endonuclease
MRTLLPDPPPADFQELLARRKRWGADTHDEVWEGVYYMAPAPHKHHADLQAQLHLLLGPLAPASGLRPYAEINVGTREDFRVPDLALLRPGPGGVYLHTAALVVEVVSPGDETWQKLPFYAAHDVDELLIVDPDTRTVYWLALTDGRYEPTERSGLIELGTAELAERIDWP